MMPLGLLGAVAVRALGLVIDYASYHVEQGAPTHQDPVGIYSPRSPRSSKLDPSYVHMSIATFA